MERHPVHGRDLDGHQHQEERSMEHMERIQDQGREGRQGLEQFQEHGVHPHERHARRPRWRLVRLPVADHGGMERRDPVR